MGCRTVRPVLALAALLSVGAGCAAPVVRAQSGEAGGVARPAPPGNLVKNPGFEEDWHHRAFAQNRRFLLLHTSDLGMAEGDGRMDHWDLGRMDPIAVWDLTNARTGSRSLRLPPNGQASQRIRFTGEQNWRQGGAYYAGFLPMEKTLAAQVARRTIRVGAWCRTAEVPPGKEPRLSVTVQCLSRAGVEATNPTQESTSGGAVAFSAGTHDWEYREVVIEPAKLPAAPTWVTVSLSSTGGRVSFDDIFCTEEAGLPNRVPNAGFEAAGPDGRPTGWGKPEVWTWWRNPYYLFTGWSHSRKPDFRGGAETDSLLTSSGGRSLRMTLYPGDNVAVASAPIALNQDRPHPLEARAMVRCDSLRGLELMAQDESGEWLPQGDFLGDDTEDDPAFYDMGSTGAGNSGWQMVRKYFSPRKPVKTVRLFLCARGFDGEIVERNHVGLVWWDDIQLLQHGSPGSPAPRPPAAAPPFRFRVTGIDLGDRLWGKNRLTVHLSFPDAAAEKQAREATANVELAAPKGKIPGIPAKVEVTDGAASLSADYVVADLCPSAAEQYRLTLRITAPGAAPVIAELPFGTPSRILTAGTSAYFAYPNETVSLYGQLNVARGSLPDLERCEITSGGKSLVEMRDFAPLLRPQGGPNYIDTRRLVRAEVKAAGAKVHPWQEPARDQEVRVRLFGRGGEKLAESEPVRFGFMQPVPRATLPGAIQRTGVDERGYVTVNGAPYFPVFWTPHFGMAPEANYPPRTVGLKSLDLTEIVLAGNKPPDAAVRAKLLARVAQAKADPKLFQYELGEGEMQLQGPAWRERANWLETAAGWIREADPNHLINGPESWLVGHPGHNQAMTAFMPGWDAIGVEASFEDVPRIRQARQGARGRTAVLVGLETYFYQPLETLRWRGFAALLEGAAGVGLCPSGMLQAKPDRENFLRGLNGEFRGLADIITAAAPPERATCDQPVIHTLERVHQGKRYLIAVRNKDTLGALKVRFAFPAGERFTRVRVRSEDRSLAAAAGGFEDLFPTRMMARVYELEK